MMPTPPTGGGTRASTSAASIRSSTVSTSTTARCRSSAVITAWSPASAPVCDLADSHDRGARRRNEALLLGAAVLVDLSEARREHDRGADAAAPAGGDRLGHTLLRHDQHRGIDTLGQVVDRGDARPSVDVLGAAADQM